MKTPLSPRERVWWAIRHQEPDCVPWHLSFTEPARAKLVAHLGTDEIDEALNNHIVSYKTRRLYDEIAPGFWRDEWGTVWNKTVDKDIGVVEKYQLAGRSLDGLQLPDPADPARFAALPGWIAANPNRFRLVSLGFSLWERAWALRGMTDLMVDMVEAPEFVEELLDTIMEWDLKILHEFLKYDIDGVRVGDDWGQQRGLQFGYRRWQRFIKPRLARLYGAVKQAGKATLQHSCGKVQELFPDLIEIGLDVFNPFQPDVMDVYEMKRIYGDRLAFYGGMSVQSLLPHGTPDEVRAEARCMLAEIGRGGGFIIAPSHDMPGDIPLENMLAFIETVQAQAEMV
jgi:uroporphyrinogen decarboxylase